MFCCGIRFKNLREWLRHKIDAHPVQIQQFAQAMGQESLENISDAERITAMQQLFELPLVLQEENMTKAQEDKITQLQQENGRLKGTIAAMGQRPDGSGEALSAEALERQLETILELLTSQATVLSNLQTQVTAQQAAPEDALPAHVIGLCQNISCETCVAQGQEIAQLAQETAREAYANEIDEALGLVAGEPIRARVAQLVRQGQTLRLQRAQMVELVA